MDSSNDQDVMITGFSFPKISTDSRVYRNNDYNCYICGHSTSMQNGFVDHFNMEHKDSQFKCDFCDHFFESSNGLFKHQRSHQYLKYSCDLCGHKTQFPYQMKSHRKTHSKTDLYGCSLCTRQFASKSSMVSHEKTHTTRIQCDQCPADKKKVFTSENSFRLHNRGMHGPGWTSKCGQHFKWKSKYTRHKHGDCKVCSKDIADSKLERYSFLRRIKIESDD